MSFVGYPHLILLLVFKRFEVTVFRKNVWKRHKPTGGHRRAGDFPTCTGRAGASPAAIVIVDVLAKKNKANRHKHPTTRKQ